MKLSEENDGKVMCRDLPETAEYSQIIYDAQEAGRLLSTNFEKCQEANGKAWSGIINLMAKCIARGMRLSTEEQNKAKSKWPSYCRMCMRRDGLDPYKVVECQKKDTCEHYPFKGKYTPPPER